MADEFDRSFLEDLDNEKLLKVGNFEYKRSLFLLSTLNKFRKEGESGFCDVILETEGRHFSVHKCVLAANSRFFYTMFNSGMKESTEKVLKLPTVSCIAMNCILDFFYTQEISLTRDIVEDVLEASSFLLLESLKKTCIAILESNLSVYNCFSTKRLALQYNADDLLGKAIKFIKDNFLCIVQKSEEFLNIPSQEFCELLDYIDIRVKDETQVFSGLMKWLKHDPIERIRELPALLKSVKVTLLPKDYIMKQLEYESSVLQNCSDLFEKCATETVSMKRLSTEVHNVLVGVGMGKCYRSFCYDIEDNETMVLPNLPKCQAVPHLVSVNKVIYILGGESQKNINFDPVNSVRTFSIECGRSDCGLLAGWVRKPSFREVRRDIAVALLDRNIYILGGWMSGPTARVECYDTNSHTWTCVAPLKIARSQLAAIATKQHLLAIGGSEDQVVGNRVVEQFDPNKNSWKFLAPLNTRRLLASVVFAHDLVYVIGGHDNAFDRITSCEMFDPSTMLWTRIASLPDTLYTNQSVVTLNNEIIAITGSPDTTSSAAWYNRDADAWEKTQNFGIQFNIAGYRLCCLEVKKFYLQELPKVKGKNSNMNLFGQQEHFVEEDDGLVADLGLSLSEEEEKSSDSDLDYFF